ncbi:MAG: DNA translocase FtsK [Bacteroidetes bacterium]|nr:MAG: DNA translocase FtsK [Bacteroidota bacterium]
MAKKAKPKPAPKTVTGSRAKENPEKHDQKLRVLGLFLLLTGLFLLFAFLSWFQSWKVDYNFADTIFKHFSFGYFFDTNIHVENWMGKTGTILSYLFITKWFGVSALFVVLVMIVTGTKLFFHYSLLPFARTIKYSFFGILWFPVFFGLLWPDTDILAGVYGYQMNQWLMDYLGLTGLILLLIFTGLSFIILTFNIPFRWMHPASSEKGPVADPAVQKGRPGTFQDDPVILPVNKLRDAPADPVSADDGFLPPTPHANIELQIEQPTGESDEPVGGGEHYGVDTLYDPTLELRNYKFPPLSLLNDYGGESLNVNKDELEANKDRIVETLSNYDIRIQKIKATIGPAVTLYEIVPEAGIRISRIKNLEDDIALSLAALGIRIIAPIPGRGTIGIEVPNQNPEIVSIKSLLSSEKFKNSPFDLPFVLGKTISNETFIADLTRMPHLLMAGATGQGKSVGLNAIITSFLYKKHPATVKFVLIDPKKVELTLYSKIERHYLAKLPDSEEAIITDTKKVIRTLNSLNLEMDARYDLLRDAQVRNVKEYNEKFLKRKLNPADGHKFLPYIVMIIDEFADLIMTAGREIENPLTRLAQLARATGIHLVIATQRPSVNIITGTIKANFPARIAFRVISKIDSRTILDGSGADQLIGRGDMLLSTGSDLIRLQCAFVDTPEVDKVTEYVGSQRGYPDAFYLPEYYDEENGSGKEFDPNERDELFAEAARLVVQHQHGSTSLIQRKLKLGYNRAGRIIDQLEAAGIVGSFEGSKARKVNFKDPGALEDFLINLEKEN